MPLFSDQELLGVLTADYGEQHERFLTQGDLALLDTLASLAGAMIYNSWLYMELEERNRELERKVDGLNAQANRWKGAFLVVLSLGAVAGWLAERASSLWTAP